MSGLSYGEYLRRNILEPAGLNSTMYDIVYGHNGALDNYFPQFGYRQVVAPVSEGKSMQGGEVAGGWGFGGQCLAHQHLHPLTGSTLALPH